MSKCNIIQNPVYIRCKVELSLCLVIGPFYFISDKKNLKKVNNKFDLSFAIFSHEF